jgi:contractile injection system tape measure protein
VPVIERVLAEFDRPGVVIRIDRIDLKLGTFSVEHLDLAAERLETILRDALVEAISTHSGSVVPLVHAHADAAEQMSTGAVPVDAALLQLLTRYLLHGIWPYRHDAAGNPAVLVANLVDRQPAALLQMIDRHSERPQFIARLAMQMPFGGLERLLNLIEPKNVAGVLATLKRLAPPRDTSTTRLLWQLVLQSVLRGELNTAAPFDRSEFEQWLMQGMAAAHMSGGSHTQHRSFTGGTTTGRRAARSGASTHVRLAHSADAPIVQDRHRADSAEPARLDLFELFLVQGTLPGGSPDALLIELIGQQPDAVAQLFRRHARNDAMLRRLTEVLNPATLERLLTLLTPDAAAIIVAHMLEVRGLHQVKPVVPLGDRPLQRLLWFISLRYVLREAGSQFNRRSFVENMIQGLANAERLTYRELLGALHAGAVEVAKATPVATSLPAIIVDLAHALEPTEVQRHAVLEIEPIAAFNDAAPQARAGSPRDRPDDDEADAWTVSDQLVGAAASLQSEPDHAPDPQTQSEFAASVAGYGDLDKLRHLLMTGVLPWRDIIADPGLTPRRVIETLRRLRPGLVRAALRGTPLNQQDLRRAIAMPDATVMALIRLLLPLNVSGQDLMQSVVSYTARATDPRGFQAKLIAALIERRMLDFETWVAASSPPLGQTSISHAKSVSADPTATLLAILADGVVGQGGTATQWAETLLRVLASDVRAARRFIAAVAKSPAALTRMAELFQPALLDRALAALVPAAAATLTRLARVAFAESSRHGLQQHDIVAAFLAEIATIDTDAAPSAGLLLHLLQRLYGDTLPPWLVPVLHRDLLPHLPGGVATALSGMLSASQQQSSMVDGSFADANGSRAPRDGPVFQPIESARQALGFDRQPDGQRVANDNAASSETPRGEHTEWLFHALAACDLSRATARDEVPELLRELMDELLERSSRDLAVRLVTFLSQARHSPYLIRLLPERQLARLMMLAAPHAEPGLLEAGEVLTEAAGAAGFAINRAALWHALFNTVVAPVGERTIVQLTERFVAMAGNAAGDPDPEQRKIAAAVLLQAATQHASDAGLAALAMSLEKQRGAVLRTSERAGRRTDRRPTSAEKTPSSKVRARTAFRLGSDNDAELRESIFIGNAGLVIANPFLPHLFGTLGLLTRDDAGKSRMRDEAAASRAVHLLQYLVDGSTDTPEPRLVLNKILCGLPVAMPVERDIEATEEERETCNMLLRSIIENWQILRNTSIAGLQETFLQREGKLVYHDTGWRLQVQRKTLDVLVDQVPWSIGVVFHAWMPSALHVTW